MSILVNLPDDHRRAYKAAAEAAGMKLSEWVRRQCEEGLPPGVRRKLSQMAGPGNPTFVKKRGRQSRK